MPKKFLWMALAGMFLTAAFLAPGKAVESVKAEGSLETQVAQILKNQEKILQDLAAIKEDLAKIRMRMH